MPGSAPKGQTTSKSRSGGLVEAVDLAGDQVILGLCLNEAGDVLGHQSIHLHWVGNLLHNSLQAQDQVEPVSCHASVTLVRWRGVDGLDVIMPPVQLADEVQRQLLASKRGSSLRPGALFHANLHPTSIQFLS